MSDSVNMWIIVGMFIVIWTIVHLIAKRVNRFGNITKIMMTAWKFRDLL